jgi:hypothetical protein
LRISDFYLQGFVDETPYSFERKLVVHVDDGEMIIVSSEWYCKAVNGAEQVARDVIKYTGRGI